MTVTVTVIVLNFNSGGYLTRCLSALHKQSCDDFSVIIADNNSNDGSFGAARQAFDVESDGGDSRFRFVEIGDNTGFAKGNNLMVAEVRTPLVALLNPDALPDPDWLHELVEAAARHPDVAMFGSTQISLLDPSRLDGVGDNYLAIGVPWRGGYGHPVATTPEENEVFSPCAAAALYRTEAFRSVGGFDEHYFCYVEDVDLGFRLRLAGARCIQVASAVVHHAGSASSANNTFAIYHGTRNMIWTFFKNMPGPLFWPLIPVHLSVLGVLAVRAMLRGEAEATLKGICAAFSDFPKLWAARRRIQSGRRVTVRVVSDAMCWAPWTYLRRAPFSIGHSNAPRVFRD